MSPLLIRVVVLPLALLATGQLAHAKQPDIRVAFTYIGLYWVDRSTVRAAARPLIKLLTEKSQTTYSLSARVGSDFADETQLLDQLKSGAINVAFTSSLQYVKLAEQVKLRPLVRSQAFGKSSFKLMILTRKGGASTLKALKGKRISLYGGDPLNRLYLTVALHRQGLGPPEGHFKAINVKQKPQSAVLDLLLGAADACVVTDVLLNTMAQLNPQLPKKLAPVATSKEFANAPLFATKHVARRHFKVLRQMPTKMHQSRTGRQLLLIFRMERMVPASEGDYASFRALWREYKQLKAKRTAAK